MKKTIQILMLTVPFLMFAQRGGSKEFSNSVVLNDTPENIWAAITDFSSFNLWDDTIVDVRCPETLTKNKNCQVILGNGNLLDIEIEDIVENESYTLRYKLSSGNMFIKRSLSGEGQVQLTETVWYKGISEKTFEKYKGADYDEQLKGRLADFKKYVEEDLAQGR